MKRRTFTQLVVLLTIGFGLSIFNLAAQDLSPWTNNPYGNEWIDYNKTYVRVGVPANGIYKIPVAPLPDAIKNPGAAHFQLWHRGKEVAIISADNNWIVFYGEKNDGASDGLMFRPGPEARLNKHVSFYSEEGSYFLTTAESPLRLAPVDVQPIDGDLDAEPYHFETFIKKYDEFQYSPTQGGYLRGFTGQQFGFSTFDVTNALNHSYMGTESGWVGPMIYGPKTSIYDPAKESWNSLSPKLLDVPITLKNWVSDATDKPVIEAVVNGLNDGSHNINIYMSTSTDDIDNQALLSFPTFDGFDGKKASITLNNPSSYITDEGVSYIRIKSLTNVNSSDQDIADFDFFSLGYYAITYPQLTQMGSLKSVAFNFKSTGNSFSKIEILDAPADVKIYNVTNPYNPIELSGGTLQGTTFTIQVPRTPNESLKLMIVDGNEEAGGVVSFASTDLKEVKLNPVYKKTNYVPFTTNGAINPLAYDYLIITNDNLEVGARTYAEYRATAKGGSYRYLIMNIRSIYDQFNYGEPSAIAIRRFVDYMIQGGVRAKHNLLLVGHSVTIPVRLLREMPGEVPTFGDPGSDVLLVCGLSNGPASIDIPAIPVGRINTFTSTELANYQNKVVEYERQTAEQSSTELSWRKNLIHLVGAKYNYELSETNSGGFKKIFKDVSGYVTQLDENRHIDVVSNDEWATSNSEEAVRQPAPISPIVNNGVGMIAYYGHGNQTGTIYDIQYVSLPEFSNTTKRYSFIYFNGCGVGNIFTSRRTQVLSTDWLVTPDKGSVAIFGNSYKSYVSPTAIYIDKLYQQLFLKTDAERRTVGQVLVDLANLTIAGSIPGGRVMADTYETSNIHQTNLYGDPAIKVLNTTNVPPAALPVNLISFNASILENKNVKLDWRTASETNNGYFVVERSYNAKNFESIGKVEGKGTVSMESVYDFVDLKPLPGFNYYRLKQIDANQDESTSTAYSKIVGVNIPDSEAFSAYPNPASDHVNIKLNTSAVLKSWALIDKSGRVIRTGTKLDVPLRNLPVGEYIIDISTNNGDKYNKKIVKQ